MDNVSADTTLQDLPIEMLEMILLKCCMWRVLDQWESTAYVPSGDMYRELAAVWSEWWFRMTRNWFVIVLKRRLKQLNPLSRYLPEAKLIRGIDFGYSVWGLTILNDELFVLSVVLPAVYVYDLKTLNSKRLLQCSEMCNPRDMAASPIHRCLYIMDVGRSPQLLLCLDSATGDVRAHCSITNEGRNLAVDQRTGNALLMCAKEIVEYDHNMQKIRAIAFPAEGMDMLWHAVLLSDNKQFVICQGWESSVWHRVFIFDSQSSSILSSYGSREPGHGRDEMNNPVHASVDTSGCVIVADSGNNRICLFSPNQLVLLRELITEQGSDYQLWEPYRVLIEPASGLLYVGSNDEHLYVFRVMHERPSALHT